MRINYSMVFVSDMAKSVAFYRDLLGIPLKFESPVWTEFNSEGATLALHLSETSPIANVGPPNQAGRCRPGFQVADLDSFHRRMVENQVPCIQEPKDLFGARVAQYADPDGLVFSVGELPVGKESG